MTAAEIRTENPDGSRAATRAVGHFGYVRRLWERRGWPSGKGGADVCSGTIHPSRSRASFSAFIFPGRRAVMNLVEEASEPAASNSQARQ
jgi:hypothetical protein